MSDASRAWPHRTRWVVAGGYVLCWIVGISVGGPELAPVAAAGAVEAEFSGSLRILLFAVLVHGVAAILLVGLGRSLARESAPRVPVVLATIAAALSLVQLAGEVVLVTAAASLPADAIWETISRVDGVKMLVLAGFVVRIHSGLLGRRIAPALLSAITVLALLTSGVGYLAVVPALMAAATASLPLLLIWVLVATSAVTSGGPARGSDRRPLG